MKARIIFYDIDEEKADRAEKMGMPIPDAESFESMIYFDIDSVKVSYINREGDIALHTTVGTWVLPFNHEIWDKIKGRLND